MSVEGTDSTAVIEPSGGVDAGSTAAPQTATSGTTSSAQTQGYSATPPAPAPGGIQYGDADLNDPLQAPRQRDEHGRFARKTPQEILGEAPPEPTAQQVAPPAPVAATPSEWLTPDVSREAMFYGFSEEEARAFESPEKLYAAFAALDRRMLRDFGQPQQLPQGQGPQGDVVPPHAPVAPQQGFNQPQQPGISGFDLSKFKDKFDTDTMEVLSGLHGHFQTEVQKQLQESQKWQSEFQKSHQTLQKLQQDWSSFQQQQAIREGQRFEAEVDGLFEGVSKDYSDVFGTGPIRELAPAFVEKRQQLVGYMDQLKQLDVQMGRPPVADQVAFSRALRVMYSDRQNQAIRNQIAREVAGRKQQAIARPSARNSAPLNPLDAAARRADEIYKKAGFDVPTHDDYHDGI